MKHGLMVSNNRSRSSSSPKYRLMNLDFSSMKTMQPSLSSAKDTDLTQRLIKLEANTKLLERQYKRNLKEGFEHKVKAYRLQAILERNLLQKAIEDAHATAKEQSQQQKTTKTMKTKQYLSLRADAVKRFRCHELDFLKQKSAQQKKQISLSIQQKMYNHEKMARQVHDRVTEQLKSIDRKKKYLEYLRITTIRKEEMQVKKFYIENIIKNTETLELLKDTLDEMVKNTISEQSTFVTS